MKSEGLVVTTGGLLTVTLTGSLAGGPQTGPLVAVTVHVSVALPAKFTGGVQVAFGVAAFGLNEPPLLDVHWPPWPNAGVLPPSPAVVPP